MALIARAWLELYAVAPLEPMQKAARVPVELGPPPSPNRAEFPYQGSLIYQGIPIYIENVKGSVRSGVGPDGPWSVTMPAHYGEFVETRGMDGDPIDVFVGTDAAAPMAYVVHQKIPGSQRMDEDKVVLGCRSADEAEALYRAAYTKGGFFAGITPWPVDELRAELRRARAWGKRLDTPPWLRDQLRKGRKDDPDKKPHHVEEPEGLTAEDEEILDAVWAKVAREGLVKKAAEGHEAARRAALPQEPDQELAKAVQIRNRPGLALRPSRTNPHARRWVRQADDPEAREPAPGQKPLPFGRSAATPPQAGPASTRSTGQPAGGVPEERGLEAAARARGNAPSSKGGVTVTPEAREAIDELYATLNSKRARGMIDWGAESRIESPSDQDVAAMGGADASTMTVRVNGKPGRVVIQAWLNPDDSPYSGKASTFQVTAQNGRTYEVRARGDGEFVVHETDYGADPKTGQFVYTAKSSPLATAKWNDLGEGLAYNDEWDAVSHGMVVFAAVQAKVRGAHAPNLTRILKAYDEPPGTLEVYNALFTIPKAHQGQGQGVACLARQVEAAGRLGVQVIHCNAARVDELEGRTTFVGYYVWARLGYNASLKDEFDGAWNTRDEQVPPGGARTMHELMATPEGRDWWRENGDSWDAQFDPTPGSASRRILSEYLDAKGGTLRLAKGRSVTFTHELAKAVVMRRRPGLVLRASKTSPGVKRWQRIAVDTSKHDAAWRSQLDGMVRPETTHPRFGTVPAFTQAEADRYHVEIAGEAKANMAKLGARVVSAIRAIGHKWPDVPVRIEASTPGQHAESAATAGHVRVGTGTNAPDFMLDADGRIDDLIEAGDRDFFTDPDVETAYFLLVEAIRDPKKAQSSKVVTLYTARPVADRDRYAKASGLPHGVFLTSDPDRAHGLAHDLSGGKADRDVYEVRVRERDLVQTLNARGVKDFQIIGRAGRTIPVVSIERMEKGGRIRLLLKATIRTPKGADGKVDYDAVPVGSSIWVTVTDPSSPLHGRPILISKRPDKTFALIGGSGAKHIQARKHLVMQGGEIRGTQVDEKRAAERKEAEARNAPRKAALRDLRKRQRAETKAAEKSFMEALGIKRRGLDEEQKATIRRAAEEHAKTTFGLDDEAAAAFAKHLTDGVAKKEEARVTREAVRRLDIARQVAGGLSLDEAEAVAGPSEAPVTIGIELPQGFESMTGPEREAAVLGALDEKEAAAHVAEAEDSRFEPDPPGAEPAAVEPTPDPETLTPVDGLPHTDLSTGGPVDTGEAARPDDLEPPAIQFDPLPAAQAGLTTAPASEPPPSGPPTFLVTLGAADSPTPEAPPVRPLANVEAARVAIEKFREVVGIHQTAKEIADQIEALPEAELAAPAAVDELRLRADAVSDEDVDRYLAAYRERAMAPPDSGFYDALSPHWNETDGNKLNGAVVNGAGSAIAAIVGNEVAARYDVRRLVDALGPEAAAIAVVQRMREELGPEAFKAFRDKLETSNATGIAATEKKALERHRELQKQSADLEAQVSSGDLQSRATIATLRARNLLEQRENLGGALGSMQASAAMFHFADVAHERGYKRRHEVKINVGTSRLALDDKLKRLGGFKRKIEYDVRTGGYSIVTDTASLRKYVTRTQANEADAARWREVKNSTADVRVDDEGREWADGYQIPGFRSHFGAEETLPPDQKHLAGKPINALAEQRNNIEWLHGAGGGLVTMRTGGGKTLVSIAVASKALHDNPKGRHLRIVPDGREEQWAAEVQNFTVHKPVVIPAKATKEERHQAIAAAPEGSIVIIGHTPAGKHDYHALGVHGWDSIGIDEPQELRAKSGSGKLSAGAKRIFKLDAPHRHALTATPATDNPVEAYDIVNWTRPGVLGFRSRFASSFSGFGGGTNAQDEAMTRMLYRELEPHVSGERVVPPHYGIHHNDVKVGMTDGQKTRQQAIEAEVEGHIEKRVAEAYQKKRDGVRGYVETSFAALRAKATEKAMGEMEARHRANLGGGDHADNAKLRALSSQLDTAGKDERHVIFVDSADQRKAVTELLKARGVAAGDVKNITSAAKNATVIKDGEVIGAIEERKRAWKGSKGGYLLIDQSSASGHNLAEGDHLHVLGNPDDAAQLLQVHGRLGRANRSGDFAIHTYRYEDSPFEHHRWNRLHRQLKVLKATAPGMFVEGARNTRTETRLQKGVRALLRLFGRGGTS